MIHEVANTRQVGGEGFRRWFTDSDFDLIIWYAGPDASAPIEGFQLCYDKRGFERALTWRRGRGFSHERVDDGESGLGVASKMTPILVPDGLFDAREVARWLSTRTSEMDPAIARFVLRVIGRYPAAD